MVTRSRPFFLSALRAALERRSVSSVVPAPSAPSEARATTTVVLPLLARAAAATSPPLPRLSFSVSRPVLAKRLRAAAPIDVSLKVALPWASSGSPVRLPGVGRDGRSPAGPWQASSRHPSGGETGPGGG